MIVPLYDHVLYCRTCCTCTRCSISSHTTNTCYCITLMAQTKLYCIVSTSSGRSSRSSHSCSMASILAASTSSAVGGGNTSPVLASTTTGAGSGSGRCFKVQTSQVSPSCSPSPVTALHSCSLTDRPDASMSESASARPIVSPMQ